MYKFIIYIYLNRVPFTPSLKSCGLKSLMKLGGLPRKFQKHPLRESFRKIMLNFNFTKESPVIENFVSLGLTKTIFTLMPGSHNWANQANRERGVKFSEPAKKHKTEQSEQGYARVNHLANHQSEVELSTPAFLHNFEHERASHTKPKI